MLRNENGNLSFARVALGSSLILTAYLLIGDAHGKLVLSEHTDNLLMWVYMTLGGVMGAGKYTNMKVTTKAKTAGPAP